MSPTGNRLGVDILVEADRRILVEEVVLHTRHTEVEEGHSLVAEDSLRRVAGPGRGRKTCQILCGSRPCFGICTQKDERRIKAVKVKGHNSEWGCRILMTRGFW